MEHTPYFVDRRDAGRRLAARVAPLISGPALVLALPRGGVPVGYEIARATGAPLDVHVVRKLGVPGFPELAMGAIASGGAVVLNDDVLARLQIPESIIDVIADRERVALELREQAYREGRPVPEVRGKTVVLVDDGLATGATMRVAVKSVRVGAPTRIIVAVPVAPPDTCAEIGEHVDDMVCVATPEPFFAVGVWYRDFSQTTDDEVRELLARRAGQLAQGREAPASAPRHGAP